MQPSTLAKRVWLLIFLAVIAFYLYGLGLLPLVGPDEPRYAQVAREMYLRRDFITPTLGGHTWFEKPALLYWMMMAGFGLFGISEAAARLGPAISGLLTVAAVFWVGRRVARASADNALCGLAPWSALVAASTLGIFVFSKGASFDIVVTMTTTWALSFFIVSESEENRKRHRLWLVGFYVFIGLSLLAKGLIGIVIPFGVVGAYHMLRREFPSQNLLRSLVWGLPLALAVSAIWYVPAIARHGWPFIDEFFVQHHFARYTSNKYRHPAPFYFYLLIIVPLTLPWTAFLIEGLWKARQWEWHGNDAKAKLRVFALAWLLLPLAFFSLSSSKLPGYILPVLPAVALLAGERLARFISQGQEGFRSMRTTGALLGLMVIAGLVFVTRSNHLAFFEAFLIAMPMVTAATVCLFFTHLRTIAALSVVCATFLVPVLAVNTDLINLANRESTRDLIQLATARGYGSAPLYGLNQTDRSAEFYAMDRLKYGPDGEPVSFDDAAKAVLAAEENHEPILVLVPLEYPDQVLKLKSAGADVIGDNGKVALVAVRPR